MADHSPTGMTIEQLELTNDTYTENKTYWDFLLSSYEGIRSLIQNGFAITRHERESQDNYDRRKDEAYAFGYSQSVVDLFNFYLFKAPAKRDMGTLSKDAQWEMFEKDCNLYGDNFQVWLLESQRWAGVFGHVGVLIDKSSQTFGSTAAEINADVYPYVARYFPQNILDWEFDRDENNRPYLKYLKLYDDDGYYRIWTNEWWAVYQVTEEVKAETSKTTVTDVSTGKIRGGTTTNQKSKAIVKPIAAGENPHREIPFVWMYNIKGKERPLGISDIKDVSYIDASIIRNLSEGEEVITYAAFPMMRKPYEEIGEGASNRGGQDDVGVTAILQFDPEQPDSKPDWLNSAVAEPIDAILKWIDMKVQEIYRATNIGGMASTEIQTQAKSGVALKSEFQLLNGKLVSKGNNVEEAELSIKRFWCMWQNKMQAFDDISVEWSENYDVENLAQDLENALTAKTIVQSKKFIAALQKNIARAMLPNAENSLLTEIDQEIDELSEQEANGFDILPDLKTIANQGSTGGALPIPKKENDETNTTN
jgi:hypothetical protein